MMHKRILSFILAFVLFVTAFPVSYAHKNQSDHDHDLLDVLFGEGYVFYDRERKLLFQDIANAASLCIDQFSTNENQKSKKSGTVHQHFCTDVSSRAGDP